MSELTDEQEDDENELDAYVETATGDFRIIIEHYRSLSIPDRGKYARMMKRLAAIPSEINITRDQMQIMFENDTDYPYN